MNHKKKFPVTNIGTVSLLMIFIVLCMVTFAALSLSEAARDNNFSKKLAAQTSQYYKASNTAEEVLSDIDFILTDALSVNPGNDSYYKKVSKDLTAQNIRDTSLTVNHDIVSYQIPMNEHHALSVSLRITSPKDAKTEGNFSIISWEEIQTTEWEGSNSLNLIQP